MSRAVIYSNSKSTSLAINPTNPTNPTNLAITTIAVTITAFLLVPDLVDVLLSLTLLTSAVLYSLNLGSSAYLLLIYISYFSSSSNKTVLVSLTFYSFLYLAILQILYRPIKK